MVMGWSAARQAAYDAVRPLSSVWRPLEQAHGLRLADPLVAADDLPRFDNAAMDGYAVAGPAPWQVLGRSLAGEAASEPLAPGRAWQVATGAPVPVGTEAVLPVEDSVARVEDSGVASIEGRIEAGRHVRLRGEESRTGEKLLEAGTRVTPQVTALAAAVGVGELRVVPPATVTALVTGDELGDGPQQVRDALTPALPGWIAWGGGALAGLARVPDGAEGLRARLEAATSDVVVVTGSSSVGPADHVRPLLARLAAVPVVDGVCCRPGSLAGLWRLPDGRLVAALPGNPFAALVSFLTVVVPVLAGLRGEPLVRLEEVPADALPRHRSDTRLVPVRHDEAGPVPVGHDRSGMLRGVAQADALAVVPAGAGRALLQPLPS